MAVSLGGDFSHHQGVINFSQFKASGRPFSVIKMSQGSGYVDSAGATNRKNAHAAGQIVGLYSFAGDFNPSTGQSVPGDPVREADHFVATIGSLQNNEFPVLDWEVQHPNPPTWCLSWLNRVYSRLQIRPMIYLNGSTMRAYNWSSVVRGNYGLWLAQPDGSLNPPATSWWSFAAIKQYSWAGRAPGVAGDVDLDVFYGSVATLQKYCKEGTPPPPAPKPPTPPAPVPSTSTLFVGHVLRAGQALHGGGFTANMQSDGNFVVYDSHGRARWSTGTYHSPGAWIQLQTDGNLVVYNPSRRPVWASNTVGKGGTNLVMQSDGNLVLYTSTRHPVWALW